MNIVRDVYHDALMYMLSVIRHFEVVISFLPIRPRSEKLLGHGEACVMKCTVSSGVISSACK